MSERIRVLFLASNPKDTKQLRLDEEIRAIDQSLRQADFRDKFDIKHGWAVRVTDLQGLLLRYKPEILHFSGHGSAIGQIILEDLAGNACPVSIRALSNLFSILKENIQCVILNACYSRKQAVAISKHIECVIGMSRAVSDKSAIAFSSALYQGLGYGRNVQMAYDLACNAIDLEALGDKDTPQLLAPRINPGKLFLVSGELLLKDVKQEQLTPREVQINRMYAEYSRSTQTLSTMSSQVELLKKSADNYELGLLKAKSELAFKEMTLWSTRAKDKFLEIIQIYKSPDSTFFLADAHRNLALLYVYEGDFSSADIHFAKAEQVAKECSCKDLARVLFTVGVGKRMMKNYQGSRKKFVEALTVIQNPNDATSENTGFLDLLCEMDLAFMQLLDAPTLGMRELENVIEKILGSGHKNAIMSARFKRAIFDVLNTDIVSARINIESAKNSMDHLFQPNWVGNFELLEGLCYFVDNDQAAEKHFYHAYRSYRRIRFIQPLWVTASILNYWLISSGKESESREILIRYQMDTKYEFESADTIFRELIPIPAHTKPEELSKLIVQI